MSAASSYVLYSCLCTFHEGYGTFLCSIFACGAIKA